jgi:hypothetical protein
LRDADGPEGEAAAPAVSRGVTVDVEARQTATPH